jgi:hypothetical protein
MNLGEITLLQVQNLGKIKFASLYLDATGNLIRIAGPNETGKSTLIDAIKLAFSSARAFKDDTIRHGCQKAEVLITTSGGYSIDRVIKKNSKGEMEGTLEVKFNGAPIKGGATTFLKSLSAAFKDPAEVADYSNQKILDMVAEFIGLDIAAIESEITEHTNEITAAKRAMRSLGDMLPPENYKPVEIDVQAILNRYNALSQAYTESFARYTKAQSQMQQLKVNIDNSNNRIAELMAELEVETKKLEAYEASKVIGLKWFEDNPVPSRDELEAAMQELNEANAAQDKIKEFQQYEVWVQNRSVFQQQIDELNNKLQAVLEKKEQALSSKQLPVANMNVFDGKIRIGETIWESCSTSQRLIAAAMLCAASIPEGGARFLYIHRGESIGSDRQAMLAEFAKKSNVQIFMEVMTESPENMVDAIIIEEGNVVYKQATDNKIEAKKPETEKPWSDIMPPEPAKKSWEDDIF